MNNEIQEATSKKELAEIIETYRTHLECMLCDAHSHLDNFKKIVDKQSILELKIKSIQSQQNKEK